MSPCTQVDVAIACPSAMNTVIVDDDLTINHNAGSIV